jgi:hypothetical protein
MATTLDVGSWRELGDHRFRSVKVCARCGMQGGGGGGGGPPPPPHVPSGQVFGSMAWDDVASLDDFVVAVAPNGGPVALTKNPGRLAALRLSGVSAVDTITICSQAGAMVRLTGGGGGGAGWQWPNAAGACVPVCADRANAHAQARLPHAGHGLDVHRVPGGGV